MISEQTERLAARFWEDAGVEESFPRTLEQIVRCMNPGLAVHSLKRLSPQAVQDWLRSHGHAVELYTEERWLNGCLYAHRGTGFVFVEAELSPGWRRVVIAHETAHFLAHYAGPRRRTERRLGPTLLAVLDGERGATEAEQLAACLADVSVQPHVHFMDRTAEGAYAEPVAEAERLADELGLELLAPWQAVFASMRGRGPWPGIASDWQQVLQIRFGLPPGWASHYAKRLIGAARGRLAFSQALGL